MLTEWKAAVLRHTPPPEDVLKTGELYLGPAAGTALAVFALGLLVFGRKAALAAGSIALVAGFAVANYRYTQFPWWPEGKAWHWLPLLVLLAQFDGLFARVPAVPTWGAWRLRLVAGFLAAILVVPPALHSHWPALVAAWPYPLQARAWPLIAFTLAVALGWAGSTAVARESPGGSVALGLALAVFGASLVILHARWGSFAEAITFPAAALVGISVVAFVRKCDVGGALPGVAVFLPAMLLVAYDETPGHAVPWSAFLLAALPPLTIGLLAIPPLSRTKAVARGLLFWVLCLGPTVAAVVLAARAESLATPGEEWTGRVVPSGG